MKKGNICTNTYFVILMLLVITLPGCTLFDWIKEKLSAPTPQTTHTLTSHVPNTYKGIPITANNIYILSSEYSPIPSQARLKLDEWLAQGDNKNLLKQLMQFKFDNEQAFKNKFQQDNQRIAQANLKNKNASNYRSYAT